jgi:hypothetical protein
MIYEEAARKRKPGKGAVQLALCKSARIRWNKNDLLKKR